MELLAGVSGRLWVDIAGCHAGGMAGPGLAREGRVVTLSSAEHEKSYEDPSVGNSVWGWFMLEEALRTRYADEDGDGDRCALIICLGDERRRASRAR